MEIDIVKVAEIIGACTVVLGVILGAYKFYDSSKRKDEKHEKEIKKMKSENTLICYGLLACLDGLEQLGANHTVPEAKNMLHKHLNKAAHDEE